MKRKKTEMKLARLWEQIIRTMKVMLLRGVELSSVIGE